jgi:hypothetical protein
MPSSIHLGFEVGTGKPVAIPVRHTCVTGQTQEAGKTTTLEALVSRSGLKTIAFVTKRFEASFKSGARIPPYFRERADWQFVASILEATLKEKMRFQRSWIIKLCQKTAKYPAPRTLADVLANTEVALETARGIHEGVYTELKAYLEIVLPQIETLKHEKSIKLRSGLNVMDLSTYSSEVQSLVIRSVIEFVYQELTETIVVVPEAWEFIPQKRGSPVKLAAEELIRKGAGGKNYVWLDSQDIASIATDIRKSVVVWLLGVQREANEVKRTLAHIPAPKPSVEAIMQLELGQFFVCHGRELKKVYVQPTWMDSKMAFDVATGKVDQAIAHEYWRTRFDRRDMAKPAPKAAGQEKNKESEQVDKQTAEKLEQENAQLKRRVRDLEAQIKNLSPSQAAKPAGSKADFENIDLDEIYAFVKSRLRKDPELLQIAISKPELEIRVERQTLSVDGESLRGRIGRMISTGFFEEPKTGNACFQDLSERQRYGVFKGNVYKELDNLVRMGFLTNVDKEGYQVVEDMKVNIVAA